MLPAMGKSIPGALGADVAMALSAGGRLLGGRPGGKAAVGLAVHSDAPVAPGLFGDPIDDRARIVAVVLIGNDVAGVVCIPRVYATTPT